MISHQSLSCLLSRWADDPDVLVSARARLYSFEKQIYNTPERMGGKFTVVLPKGLIMHRKYFTHYHSDPSLISYVDSDSAHCDDFLLSFTVSRITGRPHRLVHLPVTSLESGDVGLGTQNERKRLRLACGNYLYRRMGFGRKYSLPIGRMERGCEA
eukprot:comp19623_c0_seq1/m.23148 comp19623_c0_seq1/g.23148  ORF comp19623_c0_seq1/g.23148 comp19623_c0_seq1/m.23148 type:complete len:156 (-) comp19623_c0_seq1:378-845(-)